jgi:hypothetical protein
LFYLLLKPERKEIQDLFLLKSIIKTPSLNFKMIERSNMWKTWDEIKNNALIKKDAGIVLDELEKFINTIPPNTNKITDD